MSQPDYPTQIDVQARLRTFRAELKALESELHDSVVAHVRLSAEVSGAESPDYQQRLRQLGKDINRVSALRDIVDGATREPSSAAQTETSMPGGPGTSGDGSPEGRPAAPGTESPATGSAEVSSDAAQPAAEAARTPRQSPAASTVAVAAQADGPVAANENAAETTAGSGSPVDDIPAAQMEVLRVMAREAPDHLWRPKELIDILGLRQTTLHMRMSTAKERGLLETPSRGQWRLTPAALRLLGLGGAATREDEA